MINNAHFFKKPCIVFMRHAESCWNAPRARVQGQSRDPRIILSPHGQAAVKLLGAAPRIKPDILISSTLIRCRQTAELWLDKPFDELPMPTFMDPELVEINAGTYEGRWVDELKHDPLWNHWMSDPLTFPGFPGGENLTDFSRRVLTRAATLCVEHGDSDKLVYVITHGVVMRVIKCFLADQPLSQLWQHQVANLEEISLSSAQIKKFQALHPTLLDLQVVSNPN